MPAIPKTFTENFWCKIDTCSLYHHLRETNQYSHPIWNLAESGFKFA